VNGATETEWQRKERALSVSLFESILEEGKRSDMTW
jgi:hypothetical protein